jgi:hypothetical protein
MRDSPFIQKNVTSSHTASGDTIMDPEEIAERRKLQEELLTVSGLMDKTQITNQVLDSINVKAMLKSVDIKASQKKEPKEESVLDISKISRDISVEDLARAPLEVT